MQKSAFWLSLWLLLLFFCPCGNAEEPQLPRIVPVTESKPPRTEQLTKWIQGLSSIDDATREEAAQLIYTGMMSTIDSMWTDDGIKKQDFPKGIRDTLERSRNDLVKILKRPNIDSSDSTIAACLMCLALAKDDGSILRHAIKNELRGNADFELGAIHILLLTTPYTLSHEVSVVSPVLSDIRHLSPQARAAFKVPITSELDSAAFKISLVSLSHVFIQTDRTLREIPHLIEALNDKYPLVVRSVAVEVLAGFGEESSKALPILKELLKDDSAELRRAAACAIVRIQPMSDAKKIVEFLQLELVDRKNFLDWSLKLRKESSQVDDITEDAILLILKSPYSFYQRQALRAALRGAPISPASRTRIRKLLSTAADRETRELAQQVLEK